jgi:hypothetical protein
LVARTSWQTFLKAHFFAIAGPFFCHRVQTWQDMVTYYTVFVIDLASCRVQILGSAPHPTDLFRGQVVRAVPSADDRALATYHAPIWDRDRRGSRDGRRLFGEAGVRVVLTLEHAPMINDRDRDRRFYYCDPFFWG